MCLLGLFLVGETSLGLLTVFVSAHVGNGSGDLFLKSFFWKSSISKV